MCKMGIDCPPDNTLLGDDYGNEGGDDYGQEEPEQEEEEDLHVE